MNCKTLLVHLDDSAHSAARLAYAVQVAARHDAHLIGLYAVSEDPVDPLFVHGENVWSRRRETQRNANETNAHTHFVAETERAGINAEWRAPGGVPTQAAITHARHANLLVLGEEDPNDRSAFVARHFLDDVIIGSGRPAIVLPYAGAVRPRMENVMIAWDGGRESARAAMDALPLISRTTFVTVMTMERHSHHGEPAGIDVATWLKRHRIEASFAVVVQFRRVGLLLLSF